MSDGNGKKKGRKPIIPESERPPKPPEPEKEKKPPILPPVELTKSQRRLWISKFGEIEAMKQQAVNIVETLGMEIRRNLVEVFAEELGVEVGKGKRGFDRETMSFMDANELMKKQGQPRMTTLGRR